MKKKIVSIFLAVLMLVGIIPAQCFATGKIDPEKDVELTFSYKDEGKGTQEPSP